MQVAIIVDGGFLSKMVYPLKQAALEVDDVFRIAEEAMSAPDLKDDEMFRLYYYDCYPYKGSQKNPVTGSRVDFSATDVARANEAFLNDLCLQPKIALRSGSVQMIGWKIPPSRVRAVFRRLERGGALDERDFKPNMNQKEVDIKIGLDIAWLASKRIVDKILVITGDSDFIPAMKFARREGVRVYLATLGSRFIKDRLRIHCDGLIDVDMESLFESS